jgi:hypothetical protein
MAGALRVENYIVRIYRRDHGDPERLTGLLESVEEGTRHPFHTLNELCALLAPMSDLEQQAEGVSETNS